MGKRLAAVITRLATLGLLYVFTQTALLHAEPPPDSKLSQEDARKSQQIGRAGPDILYLQDEQGRRLVIPDISLGEFTAMYDMVRGLRRPQRTPSSLITNLDVVMVAEGDRARWDCTCKIRLFPADGHFIAIAFADSQLTSHPRLTSSDQLLAARYNEDLHQYEVYFDKDLVGEHEFRFSGLTPLRHAGAETHLKLRLPPSTLATLRLTVPGVDIVGESDSALQVERTIGEGVTSFVAQGLRSGFAFSWRPETVPSSLSPPVFDVASEIDVRVGSNGTITSDYEMVVSCFDRPIDRLTLQLPLYWTLRESDASNYSVHAIDMGEFRQVDVVLDEPAMESTIRLRLQIDEERVNEARRGPYELGGFTVLNALRHAGVIRVRAPLDWHIQIPTGEFARRVSDSELLQGANAAFEFFRPNQVTLLLSREQTELSVEPTYIVEVQESELLLTAVFRYRTRGTSPSGLSFEMSGWEFVEPDTVMHETMYIQPQLDEVQSDRGRLEIPITSASSNYAIRLQFRRTLDSSLTTSPRSLSIELPIPTDVRSLLQSTVALVWAPNVYVDDQAMQAAYAEISPSEELQADVALRDRARLCFRMQSEGPAPPLALNARTLERSTRIVCQTELLKISDAAIHVRQTLRWKVDNVVLSRATLAIDGNVSLDDLFVTVNGKQEVPVRFTSFAEETLGRRSVIVPLDGLGSFDMTVEYLVPRPWASSVAAQYINLPLVLPQKDSPRSRDEWKFSNSFLQPRVAGYKISLSTANDSWVESILTVNPEQGSGAVLASTDQALRAIPIIIERVEADVETQQFSMVVDRAWFQTWYTATGRQDRAVFSVRETEQTIRIVLPKQVLDQQLHIWVDKELQSQSSRDGGIIELVVDPEQPSHTIELVYASTTREPIGRLTMVAPRVEGADMIGQWYWHVILPRNECLLASTHSLTPAHGWRWGTWIPQGQSQLSQAYLEKWVGARVTEQRKLWGASELLFSGFGPADDLTIQTTSLPLYLLGTTGSILVVGLLILHAQARRRLAILSVLGVLLLVLLLAYPTISAIAGQAAVAGVVLVILSSAIALVVRQSRDQMSIFPATSDAASPFLDRGRRGDTGSTARLAIGAVSVISDEQDS